MHKTGKGALLIVAALACAALAAYYLYRSRVDDWIAAKLGTNASAVRTPPAFRPPAHPRRSAQAQPALAAVPPVEPSPWIEADKARFVSILQQAHPDIVVLPFLVASGANRFGIDLPARMVMAYATADRIAQTTGDKVADVEFAARAIGEPRHFARDKAMAFAAALGAKALIYGETYHDGHGHLSVSVTVLRTHASGAPEKPVTENALGISDAVTPELAYLGVVDDVVRRLGIEGKSSPAPSAAGSGLAAAFPAVPLTASADAHTSIAEGIWIQELIGTLSPYEAPRAMRWAFERALAATEDLPPSAPDYRLLRARALARLGRRTAALAMMQGQARSPEEEAFADFLQGNVPELRAAIGGIKRPVPKLVAELESVWLRTAYNMDSQQLLLLAKRLAASVPDQWAPTVFWYVVGQNQWNLGQPMQVKLVLDAQFPVFGYTAQDIVRGKVVAPNDSKLALELAGTPIVHTGKVYQQKGAGWCCESAAWKPQPHQYLDLLESHAEGMLLRDVDYVSNVQGRRDDALQLIEALDQAVFDDGSVALELRRARLLREAINETPSRERRAAIAEQLYQSSRRVRQWCTTDGAIAAEATKLEQTSSVMRVVLAGRNYSPVRYPYPLQNEQAGDAPSNGDAIEYTQAYSRAAVTPGSDPSPLALACGEALWSIAPCRAWYRSLDRSGQAEAAAAVLKDQLIDRFHGNPDRVKYLMSVYIEHGDAQAATELAQQDIRENPQDWQAYESLGGIYLAAGAYGKAAAAYGSYPGFKVSQAVNSVDVSNDAGDAGYELARRGALKEARPLLEIAARQQNYSGASFAAGMILSYMDRRFDTAMDLALKRVQRYGDGASMRAYLSLLFATGRLQDGWAAFDEAIGRRPDFSPWRSAQVGFRRGGSTAQQIQAWALRIAPLTNPDQDRALDVNALNAYVVAIQTLAMDRPAASVQAAQAIAARLFPEIAPPAPDYSKYPADQREAVRRNYESMKASLRLMKQNKRWLQKDYLDRLVAGYLAIKRRDYAAAWAAFAQGNQPAIFNDAFAASYATLPYEALAAVKTGHAEAFEANMDRFSRRAPGSPRSSYPAFDVHLSRAVLAALGGKQDDALKELSLARANMAIAHNRPLLPEYVYAEICEMLSEETGRREYLDVGLAWARAYEVYEPWSAWSYAYEAAHSTVTAERVRALAIARYLDPQSERIAGLDSDLVAKAKSWIAANQPFPGKPDHATRGDL